MTIPRALFPFLAATAVVAACAPGARRHAPPTLPVTEATAQAHMTDITYHPIGVIQSPFKQQQGTPIQPAYAGPVRGRIVIAEPYRAALADLAGFERVWLLYDFDRAGPFVPKVTPYRDSHERGLFATRAPTRPNRIGISAVKLVAVESDGIVVEEIDVLDGTPLLDIKPYVPAFDSYPQAKAGWFDETQGGRTQADNRFAPDGRK
jgi:tRNA-Thr(GGU) m(6)t(6)A37 methyltransferase TsaA